MSGFEFATSPRIVFAPGSSARGGAWVRELGVQRVFVVTDRQVHDRGLTTALLQGLAEAQVAVTLYTDVVADPPEARVQAAITAAIDCGAQAVIGIGGGSSLDTAKLVALLARTPQDLTTLYGIGLARGPRWPLMQIPTTAGTGSEVTPISILTTPTDEKKGIVSPLLYPDVAVLDSTLTVNLPPAITAATGIDAMVHAIEAVTSRHQRNPLSDVLAKKALSLLYRHLKPVLANGQDLAAREAMLLGSLLAGMAFANAPVAAVHALAYPLGGRFHLPHGLTNALVLAPVLAFNRPAAVADYAALERLLSESDAGDDEQASQAFVARFQTLVAEMPFAPRLRDHGVTASDLPLLATDALAVQRLLINNPREVTWDDALAIYQSVY